VADCTLSVLLDSLPVQEFPHFHRRSEFPISSRVMRVFNALDTEAYSACLSDLFPATAEERSMKSDSIHCDGVSWHSSC
jgi:hypothetical protein